MSTQRHEPACGGRPAWWPKLTLRTSVTIAMLVLLAVVPVSAYLLGAAFYLDLAIRLVCLAIAAAGLNLVLGYGGMISFGHAAFVGIGAYSVGIPAYYGIYDAAVQIPLAVGLCAFFALVTGAICLRTKGVYFIMITMAFGQMMFYALVSIEEYGGDDGLLIDARSQMPGGLDLENDLVLFGVCYVSLIVVLLVLHRVVNSRFGMLIQGARSNEQRMRAIGHNTYLYQLSAYVISGAICGYAGALLGNFTGLITPEMMDWTRSGELMFMVILGGAGSLSGPLLGAAIFVLLEEVLSSLTIYWPALFGALLIAAVLFVSGGVNGMLRRWEWRE